MAAHSHSMVKCMGASWGWLMPCRLASSSARSWSAALTTTRWWVGASSGPIQTWKAGRFSFGHGLVERLNIAAIAGIFVAIGALFWANRLLPVGLAERGTWEVKIFLYAWGLMLAHTLVRPVMKAWREQLWLGATLLTAVPVVDVATGPFFMRAWADANLAYLGFHATVVCTGAFLGAAAWKVARIGSQKMGTPAARPAEAKQRIAEVV